MKYALDSSMSKFVDDYTINKIGIPQSVLMERAALAVSAKTAEIAALFEREVRIAAVCGNGNNGADAICAARILSWQGLNVDIIRVCEGKTTEAFDLQADIARRSGLFFSKVEDIPKYDIIIDGIFGVGLSREVTGVYADAINLINESRNVVVSVDVPSGVDAGNGAILKTAVKADVTVTFGYNKTGIMLYPGKKLAGLVIVSDIGFFPEAIKTINPPMYFTQEDIAKIPARAADSNKGTYGRTVIIAGSEDMSGAAYLSGLAAFKCGTGLVEIITHENNSEIIRKLLPEAIVRGYNAENATDVVDKGLAKADVVILGPGLSLSDCAAGITKHVMEKITVPLIADADALNIFASEDIVLNKNVPVIFTPHIGEMTRLSKLSKEEITAGALKVAKKYATDNNVILVLKDSVTVIAEPGENKRVYINTSGCAAMSKAGMGDVLTGIIAGMLSLKLEPFSAAAMGVFIHGAAGEIASEKKGSHSVIARDVISCLKDVLITE